MLELPCSASKHWCYISQYRYKNLGTLLIVLLSQTPTSERDRFRFSFGCIVTEYEVVELRRYQLQDLDQRSDQEVEITFRNFSDLRPSRIPRYLDIFDQIFLTAVHDLPCVALNTDTDTHTHVIFLSLP